MQPLPAFLPIQTELVLEEVKHTAAGVGLPGFPLPGAGAAHMEDQASACAVPPLVCVTEVWFSQDLECNGFHYGAPVRAAGGHDVLKSWRGCRALWLGRSEGRRGRPDDVGGIAGEGDSPTGGIHIYFQCKQFSPAVHGDSTGCLGGVAGHPKQGLWRPCPGPWSLSACSRRASWFFIISS